MTSSELFDLSSADLYELGIRPVPIYEETNAIDFDLTKPVDFDYFCSNTTKTPMTINDISMRPGDDFQYEIDPETGEKTVLGVVCIPTSNPSLSFSSNHFWIEEYLSTLPTSSPSSFSNESYSSVTTQKNDASLSHFNFESISSFYSNESMIHSTMYMNENTSITSTSTAPILIPSSNINDRNIGFRTSTDDEHSMSCSSIMSNETHRYHSSVGSESMTPDSEFHFIQTKLEKIERDPQGLSMSCTSRSSSRSHSQRQHDENMLQQNKIPLTVADITQSTTEEYNQRLMQLPNLSHEQLHIIKDIRRRGKNKIAAQNCRKRKANSVESLREEVEKLKKSKHFLEKTKQRFQLEIDETRHQFEYLHQQFLPNKQLPPAIFVK